MDRISSRTSFFSCFFAAKIFESKEKSAIKIQKVFRGFLDRRSLKSFLPPSVEEACILSFERTQTHEMKRASAGKTPVYFPNDFPQIVIKETGEASANFRIRKMLHARSILMRFKCSHLVVPKVIKCSSFLLEERLPESNSVKLYQENRGLFDEPVKEMVRFFSRCHISSLVSIEKLSDFEYFVNKIRYDNILFFLSNDNTKINIGLIDLEKAGVVKKRSCQSRLRTLVAIFPHHVEMIAEEAEKLGMEFEREPLARIAEAGNRHQLELLAKPVPLEEG